MAWVHVEADVEPWSHIAGGIGLVAGCFVWWQQGCCAGIYAFYGVSFAVIGARMFWLLWLSVWLPRDVRRAANRVLAWFREQFPDEQVESVSVRAVEPGRIVVSVRSGFGMPTPRRYFAIDRHGAGEITELPVRDWWPRGLR